MNRRGTGINGNVAHPPHTKSDAELCNIKTVINVTSKPSIRSQTGRPIQRIITATFNCCYVYLIPAP